MTEPTTEIMLEIAEELTGTCGDLNKSLEDRGLKFEQLSVELLTVLDNEAMDCQLCGWWHESHELDDDQVCKDCKDMEDE